MRIKQGFLLLLAFIAGHSVWGQLPEQQIGQIDAFANQLLEDWKVPGIGLGIVQNDKIVYVQGYGQRDLESASPVTPNTLFAIGSSSKAFTGLSVLQQAEEGLIDLDAPVLDYLPEFRMYDDYVTQHLTVRDLLCHRSGLPRHDLSWYGSAASRSELMERLRYLEPSAGFREVFQYQNLMFMTAGHLVGEVANSTWEEEVQKRIFKPLGMDRANFEVDQMANDKDAALPYQKTAEGKVELMPYRNINAIGPAGSINASPKEMAAWVLALLNGGHYMGEQIAEGSSIAEAMAPAVTVPNGWVGALRFDNGNAPVAYGLGWFLSNHKGHQLVAHGGNIDGFSADVALLPADSIGLVILTNLNGNPVPGILRNYVLDLLTGTEIRDWNGEALKLREKQEEAEMTVEEDVVRQEGTTPSHDLQAYTGTFSHPGYDEIKISLQGDSLYLKMVAVPEALPLGHYHYDVFYNKDPLFGETKVQFLTDMEGAVHQAKVKLEPTLPALTLERKPEPKTFSVEELRSYTGTYLIMGVQPITVKLEGETLKMEVPGQPVYTLVYESGYKFGLKGLEGYTALFQQNSAGAVYQVTLIQPNGQFSGEKQKED
ncbi:MAG: serine hydrolase [Phaeodactylibacter sp.]|uniref:serine hydrolase n=1 Tax=Phaeodactylibacter sp. TaxID=1940289 RepID=UPI0032EDC1DA